jgi:hypothetical protein
MLLHAGAIGRRAQEHALSLRNGPLEEFIHLWDRATVVPQHEERPFQRFELRLVSRRSGAHQLGTVVGEESVVVVSMGVRTRRGIHAQAGLSVIRIHNCGLPEGGGELDGSTAGREIHLEILEADGCVIAVLHGLRHAAAKRRAELGLEEGGMEHHEGVEGDHAGHPQRHHVLASGPAAVEIPASARQAVRRDCHHRAVLEA